MKDHSVSEVTVVPNPPGPSSGGAFGIPHVFLQIMTTVATLEYLTKLGQLEKICVDRILLHNWPACFWHVFDWRHPRRP